MTVAWSRDGASIYYGREHESVSGDVYSVPLLGGDELTWFWRTQVTRSRFRMARCSLTRLNAERDAQLFPVLARYRPLYTFPVTISAYSTILASVTQDGKHAVV